MHAWERWARRAWRRIQKVFDFNERHLRRLWPIVEKVNALEPVMVGLTDAQLRAKTDEFRERLEKGETLDDLLPEAFAVVREASRRTIGLRHFDVQILGGIVLHQGKIAEMKTGEGKTLVATLPLYLNALEGKGAHLVTVNDYLAKRDARWMGPIYHFLGLTVGIIQSAGGRHVDEASFQYDPTYEPEDPRQQFLRPITRRETYRCDITYGTNHEFGFDYLRDNFSMMRAEDLVQPELHYAIIDEVDSILIDEARVPLIISGPSERSPELYYKVDRIIASLRPEVDYTVDEKARTATLTEEGVAKVERALGITNLSDPENILINHHVQAALKAHTVFRRDRDYVVKDGEIIIVDEFTGRLMPGRRWSDGLHQAIEAKERVPIQHESQTLATITYQNFFRMYRKLAGMTGTAKTEESEFARIYGMEVVVIPTNKPMVRLDHSDIVYKTEEAKFRGIVYEILQTYARQQPVLVGTRSIEVSERLSARLLPEPLQMQVMLGLIQDRLRNHPDMKKDERERLRQETYPPLEQWTPQKISRLAVQVGLNPNPLAPENVSRAMELLGLPSESRPLFLQALREGIPHNVLNAKHHEREAQIIAEAGRKGAVTIATNMAGRGVDIILGGSTGEKRHEEWTEEHERFARQIIEEKKRRYALMGYFPLPSDEELMEELKGRTLEALEVQALGGLHIIGTERHESRRIDNQLRGRSGRQGDLGSSRFYLSLQDELMRLFAPETRGKRLLQQWPEDEPVEARLITKLIENAQKRVELHNFRIREYTLKYDDVMNLQRERIYGERRKVLMGADLQETIRAMLEQTVDDYITEYANPDLPPEDWDIRELYRHLRHLAPQLPQYLSEEELEEIERPQELRARLQETFQRMYQDKEEELTPPILRQNEREIMLIVIDRCWIEHLEAMDYLRDAIGLRAYGQVDPLVAYQKEAYQYFQSLLRRIREEVLFYLFRVESAIERQVRQRVYQLGTGELPTLAEATEQGPPAGDGQRPSDGQALQPIRVERKVGRNDPCPCGSGKKYKKCCMLKEQAQR